MSRSLSYCFRISEHEYVMSGENSALYERYQASRTSEQRGENNNNVDDVKSMSYWYLNTALWFARINNEKTMAI
jgi:hypothetical protein